MPKSNWNVTTSLLPARCASGITTVLVASPKNRYFAPTSPAISVVELVVVPIAIELTVPATFPAEISLLKSMLAFIVTAPAFVSCTKSALLITRYEWSTER